MLVLLEPVNAINAEAVTSPDGRKWNFVSGGIGSFTKISKLLFDPLKNTLLFPIKNVSVRISNKPPFAVVYRKYEEVFATKSHPPPEYVSVDPMTD